MRLINYINPSGHDPFQTWFDALRDRLGKVAIQRRLDRFTEGHTGDCKFCRNGVWELRIMVGPGYRVYYAKAGDALVLLLCGGSKRTQRRDIDRAVEYWNDYQQRI